jgi:hypothetical protein
MTTVARLLCGVLLAFAAGGALAGALTQADVRKVVDAAEAAAVKHDVPGQAAQFSDDVVITVTQRGSDGIPRTSRRSKDEFIAEEIDSQVRLPDSTYASTVERIEMSADGASAKAYMKVVQTFTHQGRKAEVTGEQVMTVAQRDGKAAITAVETQANTLSLDGNKVY